MRPPGCPEERLELFLDKSGAVFEDATGGPAAAHRFAPGTRHVFGWLAGA
jgi:hypothetical protein